MRFAVPMLAAVLALVAVLAVPPASAFGRQPTNLTREQIRSLPITQRPNRPGHVYGNTVRFFYHLGRGR